MKRVLVCTMVFVLCAGIVYAKDYEVKKKAGPYAVDIRIDRNPPVIGDNAISVAVRDDAGTQVTDAKVVIAYSMPAMPGMPPMNYKEDATLSGSTYKAVMNISMSGPWNITVRITRAGKTSSAKFSIDVR